MSVDIWATFAGAVSQLVIIALAWALVQALTWPNRNRLAAEAKNVLKSCTSALKSNQESMDRLRRHLEAGAMETLHVTPSGTKFHFHAECTALEGAGNVSPVGVGFEALDPLRRAGAICSRCDTREGANAAAKARVS